MRFIVFDKYANIIAEHQLEFPQYYPNPGSVQCVAKVIEILNFLHFRWHEHDVDEIQQHANLCIEETMKTVENLGYTKNSVKVIGIL